MLASAIRVSRWTKSLHDASFASPICRLLQTLSVFLNFSIFGNRQTQTVSLGSANTQMAYATTVKQPLKNPDGFSATVADILRISLRVFFFAFVSFRSGNGNLVFCIKVSRWTKSLQDASFAGPIFGPLQTLPYLLNSRFPSVVFLNQLGLSGLDRFSQCLLSVVWP